jgi:predicted nucleotide-binding protein
MGKLGRENIRALVKGGIKTPNNISSVVYITLDAAGAWRTSIAKELKVSGYIIKDIIGTVASIKHGHI